MENMRRCAQGIREGVGTNTFLIIVTWAAVVTVPSAMCDCILSYHYVTDAHYTGNLIGTDRCWVFDSDHCMNTYVENQEDGDARECGPYIVDYDIYEGDDCTGGCKPRSFHQTMMCNYEYYLDSDDMEHCSCEYED